MYRQESFYKVQRQLDVSQTKDFKYAEQRLRTWVYI